MWVDFDFRTTGVTRRSVIMDYGLVFWTEGDNLKWKYLNDDSFLKYKLDLFTTQDINWWTEEVWVTYGLLWCFYQLFGLSFWRHPFTAEDPFVSKWCNATVLQSVPMKKQNSSTSWMPWGWVHFQKISVLCELLCYTQFNSVHKKAQAFK